MPTVRRIAPGFSPNAQIPNEAKFVGANRLTASQSDKLNKLGSLGAFKSVELRRQTIVRLQAALAKAQTALAADEADLASVLSDEFGVTIVDYGRRVVAENGDTLAIEVETA